MAFKEELLSFFRQIFANKKWLKSAIFKWNLWGEGTTIF